MNSIGPEVIAELGELSAEGRLTPTNVLERARDPESALHGHFEWDDSTAAQRYRFEQAARLIMRVRVRVVPQVEEPRLIRAVLEPAAIKPVPKPLVGPGDNDNDDPGEDRASMIFGPRTPRERSTRVDTEERLDPIKGFALMKQALVELVQVRRRYSHLTDLRFVFDAIDELVRRAFAGQRSQVAIAADLARAMMDRDGLDLYTASERAAAAYNVTTTEVREAVRARRVG